MQLPRILSILFFLLNSIWLVSSAPLQSRGLGSKLLKGVKGTKLFSGLGTFYEVGSGSCGEFDTDSDLVVAVNKEQMANGNLLLCLYRKIFPFLTPFSVYVLRCQPKPEPLL